MSKIVGSATFPCQSFHLLPGPFLGRVLKAQGSCKLWRLFSLHVRPHSPQSPPLEISSESLLSSREFRLSSGQGFVAYYSSANLALASQSSVFQDKRSPHLLISALRSSTSAYFRNPTSPLKISYIPLLILRARAALSPRQSLDVPSPVQSLLYSRVLLCLISPLSRSSLLFSLKEVFHYHGFTSSTYFISTVAVFA
jgi:hypothetical protein